jgi:hypothetical protein
VLGIPLDAANVTFASIALGIIDDDAIHFIPYVADARREGEGLLAAIQSDYVHAGRAMVNASTVVVLGFALRLLESRHRPGALSGSPERNVARCVVVLDAAYLGVLWPTHASET